MSRPSRVTPSWDVVTDVLCVGSGGGSLCAAIAAADAGLQSLVIEKADVVGGSTAMSGGVLWLPNNPIIRQAGVKDSRDEALQYFASVVGHDYPSTSKPRVEAFLDAVEPMVEFLLAHGVPLEHCTGYSDYYDDRPGGVPEGRSLETALFDTTQLGPAEPLLRVSEAIPPIPVFTREIAPLTLGVHSARGIGTALRVAARYVRATVRRRAVRGSGAALQGWMMLAAMRAHVPIWESTPVTELITDDNGAVVGVLASRFGKTIAIRARRGVLLNAGGFSHDEAMRKQYGRQPASTSWTVANPGDTGEVIKQAMSVGAAVDLMDEAWWIPTTVLPDGTPLYVVAERAKPHGIMVDGGGSRYVNEAASYMEVGQAMYDRNQRTPAIPSWWVMDSRHRRRYMWGLIPGGYTPREWLSSGYMLKAQSLVELAAKMGVDASTLTATVERFNGFAESGVDADFGKGDRAYDRFYADPGHRPNPCLGPISKPPFYAVALYPGDVGTCGGVLTDEKARVLGTSGEPIPHLYATGNCTASVVGRTYPGAGASIGASFAFGWIAAQEMCRPGIAVNADTASSNIQPS